MGDTLHRFSASLFGGLQAPPRIFPLLVAALASGCYMSHSRTRLEGDAATDVCVPDLFEAQRVYPGVHILLDRSRSMCYPLCPGELIWDYWTPAVEGVIGITSALDDDVAFGLGMFPDPAYDTADPNCYGAPISNPVMLHNADAIATTLRATPWPLGGTPTAPSLKSSLTALGSFVERRAAMVLLVTDGAPNCNSFLSCDTCVFSGPEGECTNPTQCLDDALTYAVLDDLRDAYGVRTYVLGLVGAAGWGWVEVMQQMAQHGGTDEAVLVEDPDDVGPVMEELTRQIVPCYFDVDPSDISDPDSVLFDVAGEPWDRDEARIEGWDVVEADRIRFFGEPCETILASSIETVEGTVPCH